MSELHSISDVSRISGIPKDLLRMWERRYGYPDPVRDDNGDRQYSNDHLDKLVIIRQLIDQGRRPGKLVEMTTTDLHRLLQQPTPQSAPDFDQLLALLQSDDLGGLYRWFQAQLQSYGLRAFVHQVMVPATQLVGDAWASGELAVFEEHLFTELMKSCVRQSMVENQDVSNARHNGALKPLVMLTTVTGEQHSLGLLMVEVLLRLGGAEVISFGTEMPFKDIREAAENYQVDVIGLSFSSHFKVEDAFVMVSGLRQMVDDKVQIWVGGEAFEQATCSPEGIQVLNDLYDVERELVAWRQKPV